MIINVFVVLSISIIFELYKELIYLVVHACITTPMGCKLSEKASSWLTCLFIEFPLFRLSNSAENTSEIKERLI